jgi:hypothetical protein
LMLARGMEVGVEKELEHVGIKTPR